ncbi:pentachlorophenol monooxygenase, partial [Streptomyces sp. NPDC059810]
VPRPRPGHGPELSGAHPPGLGRAVGAARAVADERLPLDVVALLPREADPDTSPDLGAPAYRDAGGEFARIYLPDGDTGFVVRPDGQLAARFPLGATTAALTDCLRTLSVPLRDPVVA